MDQYVALLEEHIFLYLDWFNQFVFNFRWKVCGETSKTQENGKCWAFDHFFAFLTWLEEIVIRLDSHIEYSLQDDTINQHFKIAYEMKIQILFQK